MDLRNATDLEFTDISSEEYRTYEFGPGKFVIINMPTHLHVSDSGGHRILDASGMSHYVPTGWVHLMWHSKDGQPHFVK
jgi:hypothetical protein